MQLVWTYSGIALSGFARPFGSYLFSKIVQKRSPVSCLKISIFGVSIATVCTALIPSYASIGSIATILLMLFRIALGFFIAGEITIARTFLMDNNNSYKMSAFYESSAMVGIILASGVSTLIFLSGETSYELWRVVFILSGMIGLFAYYLRSDAVIAISKPQEAKPLQKVKILQIFVNRVMNNITYYIPFVLMNTVIPMINKNISITEMMSYNTVLLIVDLLAFIGIAKLNLRLSPKRLICYSYGLLAILAPLLFTALEDSTLLAITAVRAVIVILGVIAVTAQNLYFNSMFKNPVDKYQVVGNSIAISDALCEVTPAAFLWLFNITGSIASLGFFIAFISVCCIYCNNLD
jgi:MHS family proline/betaine transporter-like MFS transporter